MRSHSLKIKYKEYEMLDGTKRQLVQQVSDGSIIKRFDRTPVPHKSTDAVCPHFLELKWAYGCPFNCAWCYLQGTLRFLPKKTHPVVKDYDKIKLHLESFFDKTLNSKYPPEILNSGELADSLMHENAENPFSVFIASLFDTQDRHKVLLLTKSDNIDNLLKIGSNNLLPSFTINAYPVAKRWEKGAPDVRKRIEAAEILSDSGYPVRIRIDPIVPIEEWKTEYLQLVDDLFSHFTPERITLGSLRGLQSTINNAKDKSWVEYLSERSNWGKRVDFSTSYLMYKTIIHYLKEKYDYDHVALCKETKGIWEMLGMDYRKIRCNCVW